MILYTSINNGSNSLIQLTVIKVLFDVGFYPKFLDCISVIVNGYNL